MINFSQLLADRADAIIKQWMDAVQQDRHLKSDDTLSETAVRDHLPLVLDAMVTILSKTQASELQPLVEASFQHGILRAEQGFDPVEITYEYRLLRRAIFSALEPELMSESATEVYRVVRLIDMVVDEAIGQCFKSYVDERLKELDKLQSQLAMASQELDRLVRTSQDSLSPLTDELKARLNTIIGYSELLLRQQQKQTLGVQENLPRIEHVERVLRNSRHLLHLINDATELSRYESGNLRLHLLPTDVRTTIQEIVQVTESAIAAKGLHISIDCDAAPGQVLTDPLRLRQIITNLLNNAIRYTESGSIQVRCQILPDQQWSLSITDTGIGIAPEHQSRIFDPYYRVNPGDQSFLPESTGLGLTLVNRLVTLLQGEITIESEPGVGSTFTVKFPTTVIVDSTHRGV